MFEKYKSQIFIVVGLISILYIIFTGPILYLNVPFQLMQFFGLILIGWSLLARKVNKKSFDGKLPENNFWVVKGPYEIIRHPIYAGLLLFMAGFVEVEASLPRFFALFILVIIVLLKIIREETVLEKHIKEYAQYKTKTHKLIPYFF